MERTKFGQHKPPDDKRQEWRPPTTFIKIYKGFNKTFGHIKALILCAFINQYFQSRQYKRLEDGNKFFLTIKRIGELTDLHVSTILKYIDELEKKDKIINIYREGQPRRNWYVINFEQLQFLINLSSTENRNTEKNETESGEHHLMDKSNFSDKNLSSTENRTAYISRTTNRTKRKTELAETGVSAHSLDAKKYRKKVSPKDTSPSNVNDDKALEKFRANPDFKIDDGIRYVRHPDGTYRDFYDNLLIE